MDEIVAGVNLNETERLELTLRVVARERGADSPPDRRLPGVSHERGANLPDGRSVYTSVIQLPRALDSKVDRPYVVTGQLMAMTLACINELESSIRARDDNIPQRWPAMTRADLNRMADELAATRAQLGSMMDKLGHVASHLFHSGEEQDGKIRLFKQGKQVWPTAAETEPTVTLRNEPAPGTAD